jgi:hypothetical protein
MFKQQFLDQTTISMCWLPRLYFANNPHWYLLSCCCFMDLISCTECINWPGYYSIASSVDPKNIHKASQPEHTSPTISVLPAESQIIIPYTVQDHGISVWQGIINK